MTRQQKVFMKLRTSCSSLGFSREELKSLASDIDKNLTLEEDATDDDVDTAIQKAIDAVMPALKLSQSAAQRAIQRAKKNTKSKDNDDDEDEDEDGDEDDDDEDVDDEPKTKPNKHSKKAGSRKTKEDIDIEDVIEKVTKPFVEQIKNLSTQVAELSGNKVTETRRAKLEKLVKDTGLLGKSILKNFDKMKFKDEADFEDYLDGVEADIEEENQERSKKGLTKLGTPPAAKKDENKDDEPEVLSKEAVIKLAGGKVETK